MKHDNREDRAIKIYNYSKITKLIDNHTYISFDVFDTLIKRNISEPSDIFSIIEEKYHVKDFRNKRIEAEQKAIQKISSHIPNLEEIYEELPIQNKQKIKELEETLELQFCQQNIDFYPIYQYAIQNGKKIIITTDMYLSKKTIKQILSNAKIKYDHLFLSNDVKLDKHNGKIYEYIIKKLDTRPSTILHIGDSKRGDYIKPRLCGINAVLIPKKVNKMRYYKRYASKNLDENIVLNYINNNLPINKDIYYKIGYENLGVLLFGYSEWLENKLQHDKLSNIFFLSREGALLKSSFDIIGDPSIKAHYLYVSRRSTYASRLKDVSNIDEVFKTCKMRKIVSVSDFFQNIGLDANQYDHILQNLNINKKSNIRKINERILDKLFDAIKQDIWKNATEEYQELLSYLKHEKFKGRVAISDIGWYGSMQKALAYTVDGIKIEGYYIYYAGKETNASSYLKNINNIDLKSYCDFFESFFLAQHGTTLKYKNNQPILGDYEYSKNEREIFLSIQTAALDFVKNFIIKSFPISILDHKFTSYGIIRLASRPTLDDAKLFGKIKYLDTSKYNMANPEPISKYLFNPKKFYHDFCVSCWKCGFLKKCLKLPLNYSAILSLFYRIQK